MQAPPIAPTFREALGFWLRLGFIGFGGPAGQIAIMHDYLVDKKRWISNSKFLNALNYCMLLPGPEAQQLATYTGWMLHGTRGGLAAGILFVLPSALILWILSVLYVSFGHLPAVQSVFDFLKPAVVAIVAGAVVKIGKKSLQTPLHYAVALLAFVAIYLLDIPFPLILSGAMLVGVTKYFVQRENSTSSATGLDTQKSGPKSSQNEQAAYLIRDDTILTARPWTFKNLLQNAGIAALLWLAPLLLLFAYANDFAFWKQLSLFFTKAALVTFGGAYAVLPYVAQVSVEKFAWLSNAEMLDGLALGETTPGPLIMVLAFVGFMAGYHHVGNLGAATLGLGLTVWYTFLPSFLFIFAGAPFIERHQANPALKYILQFATASVAGVMLSLCLHLAAAVLTPQQEVAWLPLAWLLISLVSLQYFKINLMTWIGLSVLAGLSWYFIRSV
jgi:chromate transporter